ncbi:hypothetical protein FRB94_007495 [Tulasnella sp. JGI-2019a]|nr:hypothetical protein FRB94_007495 [Tulasnella sp. JGI-2019a]
MLFSTSTMVATITWLTLLTPAVHAGWINNLRPRASGTPSCGVQTCPPMDKANYLVGTTSNENGVLFCSYPTEPEQDPNTYYCQYDATTGALTKDNDSAECPDKATMVNCNNPSKRSSTYGTEKPAAQPEPAAVPLNNRRSKHATRKLGTQTEEKN